MTSWSNFINPKDLKAAWHLTRADTKSDFMDSSLYVQNYAENLVAEISEISRALDVNDYRPGPRVPVDIPKSNFGTRPGSVLSLRDRIVLWSAIRLIAPKIDPLLPDGVYSYRLKKTPTKTAIFQENDAVNLPFLKQRDISQEIDDFEPWYARWEEFDTASRAAVDNGYEYLSVTDVSAYFENINIAILRDLLLEVCPTEQRIINIVIHCLSSWCPITPKGLRPLRGIPQGSSTSSFFGNIYLLDLDKHFSNLAETIDLQYFRYMDDVRIFTKSESNARKVVLEMETQLRKLHLNVQSAKTQVLSAAKGEINAHLYDFRFERLKAISNALKAEESEIRIEKYVDEVKKLLRYKPKGGRSIVGRRTGLNALESRTLRFSAGILNEHGKSDHIEPIFNGIKNSPDPRLMRSFVSAIRSHPKKSKFNNMIHKFNISEYNLFGYQEGEMVRGLRYVGKLDLEWKRYAIDKVLDGKNCDHLRYQSIMLLNRYLLKRSEVKEILDCGRNEKSPYIISALILFSGQIADYHQYQFLMSYFSNSPNVEIRSTLKTIQKLKLNQSASKKMIDHCFSDIRGGDIINNAGYLWHILRTENLGTLKTMKKPVAFFKKKHPIIGHRWIMERFEERLVKRILYLTK